MKQKHITNLNCALCMMIALLCGCASHYQVSSVSKQRIVVDSRYDNKPVAQGEAFLAPYKQKVDSIMGPVVGIVACDMAAERPESNLSNLLPDILMWAAKDYNEKPDFAV